MRKLEWLSTLLVAAAVGCGSSGGGNTNPPAPDAPAPDAEMEASVQPDVSMGTDARADARPDASVSADVPPSNAGRACTMPDPMGGMDPACGDSLVCLPTGTTPFCSNQCENDASQANERMACGGAGSTCLTQGDPPNANSICTAACRPTAMTVATGACRPGFVCTGWWYTHMGGRPDSPGCFPFCSQNSDCGMGAPGPMCNARTGSCGTTGVDMSRLPDGSPCNPMMTVMVPGEMRPRNVQCRGICFATSSANRTQGICGSFINTRVATACPDDPDNIDPRAPMGADNLAICIFRNCTTNADCRSPHVCRYPEDAMGMPVTDAPTLCDYPSMRQPMGIPGDGGTTGDASTDASPPRDATPGDASTSTDAAPADASTTG
jgi:hypothetical protein